MSPNRRVAITLEQCWHDVPGGTASSALESIRALQRHSDLDLVGVSARHGEPPPSPWAPPIPVRGLPLPRNLLYESWHRLRWPKVQRATGPVDVIHVTGMAMPPKSAPMVVTVHDLAFLHDPSHFTKHGVAFFHRAIDLARKDADIVVCPSQSTFDDCAANGFDTSRLRLVPWGIEVDPAAADAVASVRKRLGIERPYVFWTGTIEPRKNLSALLDAFGRLDRDDVDLVIGGPEGWNDELAALERRAGDRVKRIGFQPVPDLRAVYAGASVFCYPSLREGFGLPVLEAMAQGTPVITSAGTATGEVVGEADGASEAGVLVDPLDVDALATALAGLLDDKGRAAAVGAAGLTRARAFTWERTADLLVSAYDEAIGTGGTA
jgi:glycosyltransferase involved in cell wall biosynthesis